jgi:hypothetical protein
VADYRVICEWLCEPSNENGDCDTESVTKVLCSLLAIRFAENVITIFIILL